MQKWGTANGFADLGPGPVHVPYGAALTSVPFAYEVAHHGDVEDESTGAVAAGSADGMVSISGAALRGTYVPPVPRESSHVGKASVQMKVWSATAGTVITAREPSRLAKRKHQIGSLAAQAIAKAADNLEMRGAGFKTKAQTRSKYGW